MRCAGGSDLRKWPNDECLPNLQGEFQCGNIRWNPQSAVNDAETTPASSPPKLDGAAANLLRLPAFESIITSWNLSFGRSVYTACTLNPSHMGRWMVGELTVSHLR